MRREAPFAHHVFARDVFTDGVCNKDPILLIHVAEKAKRDYPDRKCVFVTQDQKFRDQVERAAGQAQKCGNVLKATRFIRALDSVKIIVFGFTNGVERNTIRAGQVVRKLVQVHVELEALV